MFVEEGHEGSLKNLLWFIVVELQEAPQLALSLLASLIVMSVGIFRKDFEDSWEDALIGGSC